MNNNKSKHTKSQHLCRVSSPQNLKHLILNVYIYLHTVQIVGQRTPGEICDKLYTLIVAKS